MDGKLYIWAGWNGKRGLDDMAVFNVDTMRWEPAPVQTGDVPSARNNHATFVYNGLIFSHGGHDGAAWLNELHVFDPADSCWSQPVTYGSPPSARACHTCTVVPQYGIAGSHMVCFGGFDGSQCFNDIDILELRSLTWSRPQVAGVKPQPRNAHSMTAVGTKLVLFGGHSGSKHMRDLHVFDVETLAWSQPELSGAVPPGLRGHTASLVGSSVFFFAGYDGRGRSNDLYLLDTNTFAFEQPSAGRGSAHVVPSGRQRHAACMLDTKRLFVFGGFDGYKWLDDMYVLDVGKLEESALTTAAVSSLLQDFEGMVNNPDTFPDLTFLVGPDSTPIVAHRSIVATRCAHFAAMLRSGMAECVTSEVHMPGWSTDAFLVLLKFLYTGRVGSMGLPIADEVMRLADFMGLLELKSLCESTLIHKIDEQHVCALFATAHRHHVDELRRHCLEFMLRPDVNVEPMLDELADEPHLLMEITKESLRRRKSLGGRRA